MQTDERYMRRALELAQLGLEEVAPNPMVGAVIVHNDCIIGEGYHERFGEAHAEVNAVNSVADKALLTEATIYVTLEPCAHFGKTPPCANLLVSHKFKRVVIAMQDPFAAVSGKGIALLRENHIEVEVGLLEKEARELNKRFLTLNEKIRPYIILKWAQSLDGFMDKDRTNNEKGIFWITAPHTKLITHKWRAQEQAILVGTNTILTDNPSLTTREYKGKNPIRLVLDPNKRIPENFAVYSDESQSFIFVKNEANHVKHVVLNPFDLQQLFHWCYNQGISSILIEGGKHTLKQFIESNSWDEARILTGNVILKNGLKAPSIEGESVDSFDFGSDHIQFISNL